MTDDTQRAIDQNLLSSLSPDPNHRAMYWLYLKDASIKGEAVVALRLTDEELCRELRARKLMDDAGKLLPVGPVDEWARVGD